MADYFSGYDLNARLEEDEDGNLPFDLNDDNGNASIISSILLCCCFVHDGNTEFHLAEPEDDDGNTFLISTTLR
jgi:hypothetical protein